MKLEHSYGIVAAYSETGHDCAVAKSSANGLYVLGSHLGTGSNTERVFKGPMSRCKVSLTSNRVTTNY